MLNLLNNYRISQEIIDNVSKYKIQKRVCLGFWKTIACEENPYSLKIFIHNIKQLEMQKATQMLEMHNA